MATKVYMEALSPTMEEGRVASWLKHEGDAVSVGDILAEVETDKAIMELQARGDGVLRKIFAPDGATADVGSLIAVIAEPDEDISGFQAGGGASSPAPAAPASSPGPAVAAPAEPAPSRTPEASPAAAPVAAGGDGRTKSSPLARRLARERGIDLATLEGSGPGGRIVKRDVEAAQPVRPAAVAPAHLSGYEDVELSQVRKTIAKRLSQSIGPVPHFFLTREIDMERVWDARQSLNALDAHPRISFNDIIVKVVAEALRHHRACNAWWQDDHIRYFNEVHIGVAVAIQDGLITPVIRNAHIKSLREIATETRDLAARARERKLKPDEYTGSTFSISNLGMFDIDEFTAVINPPEAGILAVGGIVARPVVVDDEVVIRRRMRVTMSCDHRVIDGATGAQFLQTVAQMLENPLAIVW